jgi:hypothetical protein
MANYTVRITWEAIADVVVKADNVMDAQEKARKKAATTKPTSQSVTNLRVLNIEHPKS